MRLINLDNLTIIGPGSEWFWAMAQLIVVAVSLAALYWQLRASAAANAIARIDSIQRHWESKAMTHARLQAALRLRYGIGTGFDAGSRNIRDFMDDLWSLYERRFLSDKDLLPTWSRPAIVWWELLRPEIEAQRRLEEHEGIDQDFEFLARHCAKRLRADGITIRPWDAAERMRWLDLTIERSTAQLELLGVIESGVIPRPPLEAASTESESL